MTADLNEVRAMPWDADLPYDGDATLCCLCTAEDATIWRGREAICADCAIRANMHALVADLAATREENSAYRRQVNGLAELLNRASGMIPDVYYWWHNDKAVALAAIKEKPNE